MSLLDGSVPIIIGEQRLVLYRNSNFSIISDKFTRGMIPTINHNCRVTPKVHLKLYRIKSNSVLKDVFRTRQIIKVCLMTTPSECPNPWSRSLNRQLNKKHFRQVHSLLRCSAISVSHSRKVFFDNENFTQ